MILMLNNDCLEAIFQLLDLKAQINVRRTCPRFEPIVEYIWQQKYKTVEVNYKPFRCIKDNKNSLIDFMSSIRDTVKELHFDINSVEQLKWVRHLMFPKVTCLTCDFGSDVEHTLIIAKQFPALCRLKLCGTIAGRCTWRIRNPFAPKTKERNTPLDESIEAITQCDKLLELSIDDLHLIMIVDELLLKMTRLRKLTSFTCSSYDAVLLRKISNSPRGRKVHALIYNRLFSEQNNMDHFKSIMKMENIRRLIIKDGSFENFEIEEMHLNGKSLPQLRELHLINCEIDGEDILKLVVNCPQLEVLNLSRTKTMLHPLLGIIASFIERQEREKERILPLAVCCYQSDDFFKPNLEGIQMSVTYDNVDYDIDMPCPNSFQVEWNE